MGWDCRPTKTKLCWALRNTDSYPPNSVITFKLIPKNYIH